MTDWLDSKYVNLLSSHLRNFKRKSNNLYNFSCPICGDSETKERKARGYVYDAGGKMLYTCHNRCGTMSFKNLLKQVNYVLYQEYMKESLGEQFKAKGHTEQKYEKVLDNVKNPITIFKGLKKVSQLHHSHPCKEYVVERQIPNPWHAKLYWCPNFMVYTNELIPEKFEEKSLRHDEGRLLIPFIGTDQKIFGYQGRSLDPDAEVRYISIILSDNYPKIFNLDQVDQTRVNWLLEGPIDAMYIKNAAACGGGELYQAVASMNRDTTVQVFDNEPRHPDTVKKMKKAINLDYKVVIWPRYIKEKDISKMVTSGHLDPDFIETVMRKNVYQGLEAKLKFNDWKKTDGRILEKSKKMQPLELV